MVGRKTFAGFPTDVNSVKPDAGLDNVPPAVTILKEVYGYER